jgi:small subunit ribosomal protein S10
MANKMIYWICMKAFGHEDLDRYLVDLSEKASEVGLELKGPLNLPRRVKRFTVLKSPHVNKTSREQFEMRIHSRLIGFAHRDTDVLEVFMTDMKRKFPVGLNLKITRELGFYNGGETRPAASTPGAD